ncbi:MAG: Rho termination factor N-terminal domain-containing protein [Lachnospiraceae bacterium]|nr:Rho termination factor N-terminal domain-containing protein [Lachnospiraceae bacterium]
MLQSGKEFERQELETKTVEELRKVCKECGISYHEGGKKIKKAQMIDRIIENTISTNNEEPTDVVKMYEQAAVNEECEAEEFEFMLDGEKEELKRKQKEKYVEKANIGTIVAFKIPDGSGRVKSAAIKKKSTKRRMFMVETKYGAEFKVSFDDIVWVRTGKRWPNGVYQLFYRDGKMEVTKDGKEIN